MLIKIACMCGKTSDWDFQSNNVFNCTCGKKLNAASIFLKNKFKFVILENLQKERRFVRIIPNLFLSWLPLIIVCFLSLIGSVLRGGIVFITLWFIITLVSGIFSTLKVLTRKRLVQNGYSVIGVAKKKGSESYTGAFHIQPKGKKYSIQIC